HFVFLLHLLHALRNGPREGGPLGQRLGRAFAAARRPLRNAGAFCAVLCRDIPEVAGPVGPGEVLERLRGPARRLRWDVADCHDTFYLSDLPPLDRAAFAKEILKQLAGYTDDELVEWFRHGRGPVRAAGQALARALPPPPPRTLTGALAALLERPRLARARPLV